MKEIIEGKAKQLTPIRAAPRPPGAPGQRAPYPVSGPSAAPANSWGMPVSPTGYSQQTANLPYPLNPVGLPAIPPYR